ncbi:MAG: gamma-glutamyltransferase [Gammaproteobacteria bacterium]
MKNAGAVACGHKETALAAKQIIEAGGNAFDAVVASFFAACVAEPVLASLGGGGFLMARPVAAKPVLYDFFAQTPATKRELEEIDFFPIQANFGETLQEFHIGMGSVATPGAVKGMFAVYRDLCTLPLKILLQPAIELARTGVVVNDLQAYIFDIVKPIYQLQEDSLRIFSTRQQGKSNPRQLVRPGETLTQALLADTLEALVTDGERLFYEGEIAHSIVNACREHGGYLRPVDLQNYRVVKRQPLTLDYHGHRIWTNPPPSSGGLLIAFALKLLEALDIQQLTPGSQDHINLLCNLMHLTNKARIDSEIRLNNSDKQRMLDPDYMSSYRQTILDRYTFTRGTTHISVIDKNGNTASLTVSNGEGCGFVIPHTGIMLNNMLGEEDLNPQGFHQWKPNQRISSMMAPTIVDDGQRVVALGSGGSNRLRTAILQVLFNLFHFGMTLEDAIDAPRIHFENGLLNIENGFEAVNQQHLRPVLKDVKTWRSRNLYFGGVHAVMQQKGQLSGKGDPRRGGYSTTVQEME